MQWNLRRRCASATLAAVVFILGTGVLQARETPEYLIRISTENTAEHVQTQAIERFSRQLEQASEGRIAVQFRHSAQLFRDRDVIAALTSGKVEMAVPGMWQLDRYVPDVGLYMLPLFYGRSAQENYRLRDAELGTAVSRRIQSDLGVEVLGRWLDLGHANLYFTDRQVKRHENLAGVRIRIPGGVVNRARLEAFDAIPVLVAWPDLSNALEYDQVRGVLTTHETVRSAQLWRNGIRSSLEDKAYFAQYVPIMNVRFWQRLPQDLRQMVRMTWEQVVDDQRNAAARAQQNARDALLAEGIEITVPSPDELVQWRQVARQQQAAMVREMGVDPVLVDQAEAVMGH